MYFCMGNPNPKPWMPVQLVNNLSRVDIQKTSNTKVWAAYQGHQDSPVTAQHVDE